MPSVNLDPANSFLIVVDVQDRFLSPIFESERVESRCHFLCEVASLFGVQILGTEQYPERMGGTVESLKEFVSEPHRKMEFSGMKNPEFSSVVGGLGRTQAIVVGIETHICVSQTCHDLLQKGFEVIVCPDAVSARTQDRHKLGMERIRDAGIIPAHTEAVAYEWCRSADNPNFRTMLNVVKNARF